MSSGKRLKNFLINRGYRLSKTTHIERLKDFLQAVYPLVTEHPLIRIGSPGDGGYLVPNDLEGISTCFSPGVSETADFEGTSEADLAKQIAAVAKGEHKHPKKLTLTDDDIANIAAYWASAAKK